MIPPSHFTEENTEPGQRRFKLPKGTHWHQTDPGREHRLSNPSPHLWALRMNHHLNPLSPAGPRTKSNSSLWEPGKEPSASVFKSRNNTSSLKPSLSVKAPTHSWKASTLTTVNEHMSFFISCICHMTQMYVLLPEASLETKINLPYNLLKTISNSSYELSHS